MPRFVKAAAKQLNEKSTKTRIAAFQSLRQLVSTLPGCLSSLASSIIGGVDKALKDGTSNSLRIEALLFLQLAISCHTPATFQPYLPTLLPAVTALADDRYYKTIAEALRVCTELVRLLRPEPPAKSFAYEPHVEPLYRVVERRLQAQDQDQEVKECAITCMGTMLIHFADHAVVEPAVVLPIILERMRNEITRVTAVKTFGHISSAKLDVQLTAPLPSGATVVQAVLAELCTFLRKSNRPLRQAALVTLELILRSPYASSIPDVDVAGALQELSSLVTDADLHVAHLALVLARTIVSTKPVQMAAPIKDVLLPRTLSLLTSSVLQGVALRSLLAFFSHLVACDVPGLTFDAITTMLLSLLAQSRFLCLTVLREFEAQT